RATFLADDSLGWVYQFWQTKKKDEVNRSEEKIDGHTLPAVTQLFTEHYMVQFLLHNTLGAWWCARHGIKGPAGGAGVPGRVGPGRDGIPPLEGRRHASSGHLRGLAEVSGRVQHARSLLRQRPFPRVCFQPAGPIADARRGVVGH